MPDHSALCLCVSTLRLCENEFPAEALSEDAGAQLGSDLATHTPCVSVPRNVAILTAGQAQAPRNSLAIR